MQTGSTEGEAVGFSRPAVTTGAVLSWRGRSSLSLGQPRAIYSSYNSSLPTITVASPSTTRYGEATDEETSCGPAELVDDKVDAEDGGPQQSLLQSTTSALSSDTRQPGNLPLPGSQTVTTAQNLQGMPGLGPGKQLSGSDSCWGFGHNGQAFSLDAGAPLGVTIPTGNTAVTTGQNQPYFSYDSDSGAEEGRVVVKREGLRSSSKRHLQDSCCDPEARTSSEEKEMGTEFHANAPGVSDDERRRIRRRINNRESARRVREKRETDLRSATYKVAELEAEQAKLQTHCADLEAGCKLLHTEVAEVRAQWHKAVADNTRLKTELRYQRNNVQLGLGMQDLGQGHGTHNHEPGQGSNPACMPTEAEMAADLGLGGFEMDLFSSAQGSEWPAW